MEIRTSHSSEPVEAEAIRITVHDKEFMIQQAADCEQHGHNNKEVETMSMGEAILAIKNR